MDTTTIQPLTIKPELLDRAQKHKLSVSIEMQAINQRIKDAEEFLKSHNFRAPAIINGIMWSPSHQRITYDNKPLIEHKLEIRVKLHVHMEKLIEAVVVLNDGGLK